MIKCCVRLQAEMKRRRMEQRGDPSAKVNKKALRMPSKDASAFD